MKKLKHYEMLYRKNDQTGHVIIDITLSDYMSFFHEWDNSPFKRRDIHSELAQFLDMCSDDIPLKKKLEIVFTIESGLKNEEKENLIRQSYFNYYTSHLRLEKRKTKRILRSSILLLFISLVLLGVYSLLQETEIINITLRVLRESLLIGGWVFAWESVHLLFLDNIQPLLREREIKRFVDTEITFVYQ